MYSFIHNKVRNRLGVKKAEDLVYIYTNSKLLRERRGADPILWYENHPFSEESDSDIGVMSIEEGDEEEFNSRDVDGLQDGCNDGGGNGDENVEDSEWEFDIDNGGVDRSEPPLLNKSIEGNVHGGDIRVFDWSEFD